MSVSAMALRTLSFGDAELSVWGAAWLADPDTGSLAALGTAGERHVLPGLRLSGGPDGDGWQLDGDEGTLTVAPAGEAVAVSAPEGRVEGYDQLCRVTGRFALDGAEHPVDCPGLRSWWSDPLDLAQFESIRTVAALFAPDEALALTAFRKRKARAHDADLVAAAVIAPDVSAAVEDPRLSTTYEARGWPVRAGLELWLPSGEEGSERQYSRRASGEATGARVQASVGGLDLLAEPFRWHSRGRDGAGMYILARRQ
jgi:hypothetical protein